MPTIFHTADVHLDAPFTFLGRNGQRQRQRVQDTFREFVDRALAEACDLVLIAGDLFDSNSPSQKAVDFAVSQLKRLSVPAMILPGTHDCFNQRSIYRKTDFGKLCPNVFVFTNGQGEQKEIPHLGLTVHARANLTNQSPFSPLGGLKRIGRSRWNVAMAHGSVVIPGLSGSSDFPIPPKQLAACGMDYVALGHWHTPGNYSQGRVTAFYSGSLEALSFDGSASGGSFIKVLLSDSGQAQVKEEKIGQGKFASLSIPMDGKDSPEEVKSLVLARSDPELTIAVTLTGMKEVGLVLDVDDLAGELAGEFFYLRISDQAHAKLASLSAEAFQKNTVISRFVGIMQSRLSAASSPEEARLAEDALQIGVALLQGKEVLD